MSIKNELEEIVSESLQKNQIKYDKNKIIIEIPKNEQNGDYSTNIALVLAKELHDNPMNIANKIKDKINSNLLEETTIANPGFINFKINKKEIPKIINKILHEEKKYGENNIGNNKKINIEYVSANPTGTLHIGHGRGAAYGDNLSRILSLSGYNVTRDYDYSKPIYGTKTVDTGIKSSTNLSKN